MQLFAQHRRESVTLLTPAPMSLVMTMMRHRVWSPSATGAIFPVTMEALTGTCSCRRRMKLCRSQSAEAPGASSCDWESGKQPSGWLFSLRICVIKYMSCGSRSKDCTASEITIKRSTRSFLRPCSFKSLSFQLKQGDRQSLCVSGWKVETPMMVKAGSW